MIETKNNIVGSIKPKLNIAGKINKTIEYISPNNQEKSVIPTKEIQEIIPDEKYNGLSKVIVDKIPDEYIIPQGDLEISQNGTYDVTNYASANVNVPEKQLGTKTITSNGIYKAIDDNLDGYNEIEVATSGVDLNDYIKSTIEEGASSYSAGQWIKSVKQLPAFTFTGKNTSYHFSCFKGGSIDLSNFNTSNVTDMHYMFSDCSSLTSLDLSSFNTPNVTDMNSMFRNCSSLTSLDLSSFNTTNVTNMASLFNSCSSLTSLDLSSFNTTNVTKMAGMFMYCSSLTSLDLSSFNTSNVTNMNNMFYYCSKLTNLDVSSFNTSNVTNMDAMFRECVSLTSLDLSSLTAASLTSANMMFYNCLNITSIDLSSFENTKTVSVSQMFQYCSKLSNLNMSKFDFTKISSYSSMFNYVPKNCYILVKDEAQKTAFNTKFPKMTNVHYVGEEEEAGA